MLGADTYDAVYIAKNAIERAGTLNKTNVRDALEATDMPQSLLIMAERKNNTSALALTIMRFCRRLSLNNSSGTRRSEQLKPLVVYPDTMPGISSFKQGRFRSTRQTMRLEAHKLLRQTLFFLFLLISHVLNSQHEKIREAD